MQVSWRSKIYRLEELDLRSAVELEENVQQKWMKWKELSLKAGYTQYILTKTINNINRLSWIYGEVIHAIQKKRNCTMKDKIISKGRKKSVFHWGRNSSDFVVE